MNDRLTHHVKVEGWPRVKKVMQEFKKRRNKDFYLDVHQIGFDLFEIKVFKGAMK